VDWKSSTPINGNYSPINSVTPIARLELRKKFDAGVKEGVALALEEHYRMGRSIVVWRDGKVVHLKPEEYKHSIASVLYPDGQTDPSTGSG
jgi:hypothetical protein